MNSYLGAMGLSLGLAWVLVRSAVVHAEPLPVELEVGAISGDCGSGGVELKIEPGVGFRLLYSGLNLSTQSQRSVRLSCTVRLKVNAPSGFQVRLPEVSVKGAAKLKPGRGSGMVSLRVFFHGGRSQGGYLKLDAGEGESAVRVTSAGEERWSRCGEDLSLSVLVDASVQDLEPSEPQAANEQEGAAELSLSEAAAQALLYRRCQ